MRNAHVYFQSVNREKFSKGVQFLLHHFLPATNTEVCFVSVNNLKNTVMNLQPMGREWCLIGRLYQLLICRQVKGRIIQKAEEKYSEYKAEKEKRTSYGRLSITPSLDDGEGAISLPPGVVTIKILINFYTPDGAFLSNTTQWGQCWAAVVASQKLS